MRSKTRHLPGFLTLGVEGWQVEREGNHIDLIISLLIRFPQIGTIHYEPEQCSLRMVFLLSGENNLQDFISRFRTHLVLFHELRQEMVEIFSLEAASCAKLTKIEIRRDLASLSVSELNLIVTLIADYYADVLIQEGPEYDEDERLDQNEIIEALLNTVPLKNSERLTGFRENGKVLVFSLPLAGVSK